jgi:phosphate/phosphite/phosphonate ABC transporter binding protein
VQSSEGPPEAELTFAISSSAPEAEGLLALCCGELAREISRPVRPRVLPSYAALRDEVEAGRAQIAWAPPRIAIDLEDAGLASIDVCSVRGGQVAYHAAIFTRHASPIETLADLRGRNAVWVDAGSAAGYLLPRLKLRAEGLDPETLFGKETFLGTHARVAVAVLSGEADVGGTYLSLDPRTKRPVSAGWLEAGAGINGAHILAMVGPIPSDTIVFSRRIPAEEKAELVTRVLGLPVALPEVVGRLLGAEGFERASPAHFEALRELLRARA